MPDYPALISFVLHVPVPASAVSGASCRLRFRPDVRRSYLCRYPQDRFAGENRIAPLRAMNISSANDSAASIVR